MTRVLITIDTELSAGLHQQGVSLSDNFALSIRGRTPSGDYGVGWMMDRFDEYGLTGVFFVDPMPALVYGPAFLTDIVGPIVARGHEVQLHIHTEWLQWAKISPVEGRVRRNIGDYSPADQKTLLGTALKLLVAAGAPWPAAFRAGNFGANEATLAALKTLGITYDSSFNSVIDHAVCGIDLPYDTIEPLRHRGVVEMPVSVVGRTQGALRPAQICAMSVWEMRAMLRHAVAEAMSAQTIVTHSFEMLNRARTRPNHMIIRRFEALCAEIARHPDLVSRGFATVDPHRVVAGCKRSEPLAGSLVRSAARMAAQVGSNLIYDGSLRQS
jgi:hypothetical protein